MDVPRGIMPPSPSARAGVRVFCRVLLCAVHAGLFAQPELIRREAAGAIVLSEISAYAGSICAVFDGGTVKAFSAEGKFFWEFKSGGRLSPFITRSRSAAVYVCRTNGEFFALNRAGMKQWQLSLYETLSAPVVCGWDERLFIFTANTARCVSASGQPLWKHAFDAPFAGEPQLSAQGGFVVMLQNKSLCNVSAFGSITEIKLAAQPAFIAPVSAPRTGGARILVIYEDGRLELYDSSGEARGGLTHLNGAPAAVSSRGSLACAQLTSGQLVMLDTDSGRTLWRAPFSAGVGAPSNRAQKTRVQFDALRDAVYVFSISGAAGFSRSEGTPLWSLKLENAAVTPAFDDGMVYSGGRDWLLYLYRVEDRTAAIRRPQISAPGRYGLGDPPSGKEWAAITGAYTRDFTGVLKAIGQSIENGSLGEDEPAISRLLMGIADDRAVNPLESVEAVKLLGMIGSPEIIPFLLRKLREEPDISLQTEIALALGRIGLDPRGSVFDHFERIINRNQPVREEPLLFGIAAAAGNICRFTGPEASERGIKLLVALAGESSAPAVQRRAQRELLLLLR